MSSFYLLLRRIKKTVEIEHRHQAEGVDLFAPERTDDLRDLEVAWEDLTETVFDVILQLPVVPEDRDLRRVAFLMKSVFEIEEPCDRAHFVAEARRHRDLFDCAVPGMQGEITTRLIGRFFQVFDQMAELKQFGGTPVKAPPSDCIGMNPA
ncbi:hypothetical protein BG454_18305 [Roseinatronobacter bogoriensis subsp. barguzinensis]|uniref:Uncharacterized protein n=2 Tax=Roseinatronobacter bogoriensis TaxID=119542 RepID=A0A2K8KHR9_9RHOB|nr:hypothetical protein BG454_18305 [Rhodobaca barguzinensis]